MAIKGFSWRLTEELVEKVYDQGKRRGMTRQEVISECLSRWVKAGGEEEGEVKGPDGEGERVGEEKGEEGEEGARKRAFFLYERSNLGERLYAPLIAQLGLERDVAAYIQRLSAQNSWSEAYAVKYCVERAYASRSKPVAAQRESRAETRGPGEDCPHPMAERRGTRCGLCGRVVYPRRRG